MTYKREFKSAQEEVIYLKKLLKRFPNFKRGEYIDIDAQDGNTYEIGIDQDGQTFWMKTARGEELSLGWSSGHISDAWKFLLDKVLADVIEELENIPAYGVVINGKTYPVKK